MGNCLKRSTADDISLLRGNESSRDSSDQIGPAPYAVNDSKDVIGTNFNEFITGNNATSFLSITIG